MEKSGLDLLQDIVEKLNLLEQKINVLDHNIKQIANSAKLSELITKASDSPFKSWTNNTQGENIKEEVEKLKKQLGKITKPTIQAVDYTPPTGPVIQAVDPSTMFNNISEVQEALKPTMPKASPQKIYARGKVTAKIDGKEVPVSMAEVTIYDDKDKIIKQTRANMGGVWQQMLSPGKYVAEIKGKYKDKKLTPKNIIFVVNEGQEEVVVEQ